MVGKTPQVIAQLAGISVQMMLVFLIAGGEGVGKQYPYSMEKLAPVLEFLYC